MFPENLYSPKLSWTEFASHLPFWSKTSESAWISLDQLGNRLRQPSKISYIVLDRRITNVLQLFKCVSRCFTVCVDCDALVTGASGWEQFCNSLAIFLGSLQCSAVQDCLDIICSYPLSVSFLAISPCLSCIASRTTLTHDRGVVLNTVGPYESCLWVWQCLQQGCQNVSNDISQGNLN